MRMIETPVTSIAGQDRALDGRGAAPPRQQRRVHVEAARGGERRGRLAAGSGRRRRPRRRRDRSARGARATGLVAQSGRLLDGNTGLEGARLHRRERDTPPAARRAVGTRVDGGDVVRRGAARRARGRRKPGVPMKTTRTAPPSGARQRDCVGLAVAAERGSPLLGRRAVDDEQAVEVIGLVLEHGAQAAPPPRCGPCRPEVERLAHAGCRPRSTGTVMPGSERQPSSSTSVSVGRLDDRRDCTAPRGRRRCRRR